MAEMVVVKSKIKEVAKNCNVAGDFPEALNSGVICMIKMAKGRADGNGRKTVQAKDAYVGKQKAKVMLLSKSKVKEAVGNKHNVSGDFADALNEMVVWCVEQACERACANNRKTICAKDL